MREDLRMAEWINNHRIKNLDGFFIFITDTASFVAYSIPLVLLIYAFYIKKRNIKIIGFQLLASILLSTVVITTLKNVLKRPRPYELDPLIHKLSSGGGFSFPSGHTADAFVMATGITLVVDRWPLLLIPIWIWAFIVAYSRVLLGVHYISDIMAAIFIAFCSALLMQVAARKYKNNWTAQKI
ncbi:MAG: hypothetical protein NVS9B7_00230 [Flavisolibacter sp.]